MLFFLVKKLRFAIKRRISVIFSADWSCLTYRERKMRIAEFYFDWEFLPSNIWTDEQCKSTGVLIALSDSWSWLVCLVGEVFIALCHFETHRRCDWNWAVLQSCHPLLFVSCSIALRASVYFRSGTHNQTHVHTSLLVRSSFVFLLQQVGLHRSNARQFRFPSPDQTFRSTASTRIISHRTRTPAESSPPSETRGLDSSLDQFNPTPSSEETLHPLQWHLQWANRIAGLSQDRCSWAGSFYAQAPTSAVHTYEQRSGRIEPQARA